MNIGQQMTLRECSDIGEFFSELYRDESNWSQETFGTDAEHGPIGALKHLEKEAREAQAEPGDMMEYADCFLLILDASRRAGFDLWVLLQASRTKLEMCKQRKWQKQNGDEPAEHIRDTSNK